MIHVAAKAAGTPWWSYVLAFFGVIISGLGGIWLKHFLDQRTAKTDQIYGNWVSKVHEVYQLIARAKRDLGAKRVLVIRSENGGGVPKPGSQIYLSVVYEAYDPPLKGCYAEFQRYPADAQYAALLDAVYREGYALMRPESMDDGWLKDYYLSKHIYAAEVIRIYIDPTRLVYLSLNYKKLEEDCHEVDFDSPQHRAARNNYTEQLRKAFAEMRELTDS